MNLGDEGFGFELQRRERSAIVDDEVGAANLFFEGHLTEILPIEVELIAAVSRADARETGLAGCSHDHNRPQGALLTGFKQQRDVVAGESVALGAERAEGALGALANRRMDDRVQKCPLRGIAEGQLGEASSVESTVRLQDRRSEGSRQFGEHRSARFDDFSSQCIRADDGDPSFCEKPRYRGFSAADAPRQAEHMRTFHCSLPCDARRFRARATPLSLRFSLSRRAAVALLGIVLSSSAQAGPGGPTDHCVSGGAPLVHLPALDDQDRFVFATADASVHGFEADGRYRFTTTLEALPLGTLVRPDGRFFVTTADRRLHAFSPEGLELWSLTLFDLPRGGPIHAGPGKVAVMGTRGELSVVSESGARLYSVRVAGTRGAPVSSGAFFWLATDAGDLRAVEGAWRVRELAFDGTPALVGSAAGGALLVRSGADLLRVDVRGVERLEARVRFATQRAGYTGLVVGRTKASLEADLTLLDAKGRSLGRDRLLAPTRIPPAVGRGEVFAALEDGRVQVLGPERREVFAGFSRSPDGLTAGKRAVLGLFAGHRVCLLP